MHGCTTTNVSQPLAASALTTGCCPYHTVGLQPNRLHSLLPLCSPRAGKAIDCASVGVYTLGEGPSCRGLSLASEYETPGAS